MKRGDIVREKRGNFVGLCVTNTLPSGNVVLTFYNVGELRTCMKNHNDIEVIEFADGRINEALFPKNERAEDQRFEEEFYGVHRQPVRARGISINAYMQGYAQVVAQRPRWEANPFDVEEDVVNEVGDHVDF